MKTFEEWKEDYGLVWESNYCRATDQDCEAAWNASAENSVDEIAKRDERIASLIAAGAEYQRQFFEQSDQIKELSEDRDTWKARTEFSFQQRDELAAQNQQLREALTKIGEVASPYRDGVKFNYIADLSQEALSAPDIASPVLNRVKAEALNGKTKERKEGETGCALNIA